jgi:quinate dehydrogenase
VILGTEAVIYQGLEQDRYWTGKEIADLPSKQVHIAIADALKAHGKQKRELRRELWGPKRS